MKKFVFLFIAMLTFSIASQASSKISGETKMNITGYTTAIAGGAVAAMRKIEQEAVGNFSNMDGDDDYDDYTEYNGDASDDFLDFGGEHSNLMAAVEGHNFTFTIANAKNAPRTIYFMPSTKNKTAAGDNAVGTLTEGVFAAIDDVAETNITASGDSYGTIDFIRRFVENNPTYVKAFQLASNTSAGISQCRISVEQVSPFRQLQARILKPTMYQDQNMFNDKVINIPAGFDLNDQCCVKLTIAAATTLTVTVVCGAVLNSASALQTKRKKARGRK